MSGLTPSQTVGPYFKLGLDWPDAWCLADEGAAGVRIRIAGCILDGDGAPVPDALLELWQADAAGRLPAPAGGGMRSFGRSAVDAAGRYAFATVKPGRLPGAHDDLQAPHVCLVVFARGLLRHLYTRIYFADEVAANATDAVLARVPAARRATLLAAPSAGGYRFDIHLQGARETVFFDV